MDFQLRVGLSPLKRHKKSHKFTGYENELSDTCNCLTGLETTCYFLLHCPNCIVHRKILFGTVNPILRSHMEHYIYGEDTLYPTSNINTSVYLFRPKVH